MIAIFRGQCQVGKALAKSMAEDKEEPHRALTYKEYKRVKIAEHASKAKFLP